MLVLPEEYLRAAQERVTECREAYDRHRYVVDHYLAGLTVECILRAYRVRESTEFHSRHNLRELFTMSRFTFVVPRGRQEEVVAALNNVVARWSNTYRFVSIDGLRADLRRRKLNRGIKGDFVKESARVAANAATLLVSIGVERWTIS